MIILSRKTHGCWGNPPFLGTSTSPFQGTFIIAALAIETGFSTFAPHRWPQSFQLKNAPPVGELSGSFLGEVKIRLSYLDLHSLVDYSWLMYLSDLFEFLVFGFKTFDVFEVLPPNSNSRILEEITRLQSRIGTGWIKGNYMNQRSSTDHRNFTSIHLHLNHLHFLGAIEKQKKLFKWIFHGNCLKLAQKSMSNHRKPPKWLWTSAIVVPFFCSVLSV